MRDLLSSLTTNLHILVIAILLTGLGLGMITGTVSGRSQTEQDQPVITLSTTPSIPSGQPQSGPHSSATNPSNSPVSPVKPPTMPAMSSERQNTALPSSDVPAAPVAPTPPSEQPLCATCSSTADCPDSCLNQPSLPWRPAPPTVTCCGGKKVTIAYQPSFTMCPTGCTPATAQ